MLLKKLIPQMAYAIGHSKFEEALTRISYMQKKTRSIFYKQDIYSNNNTITTPLPLSKLTLFTT